MAATAATGQICDGSISIFVCDTQVYMCVKFGAFIKKSTIYLLSCPIIFHTYERLKNLTHDNVMG